MQGLWRDSLSVIEDDRKAVAVHLASRFEGAAARRVDRGGGGARGVGNEILFFRTTARLGRRRLKSPCLLPAIRSGSRRSAGRAPVVGCRGSAASLRPQADFCCRVACRPVRLNPLFHAAPASLGAATEYRRLCL